MASDTSSSPFAAYPAPVRAFGGAALVVLLVLVCASIAVSLGTALVEALGADPDGAAGTALRSAFQFVGFGVAGAGYLALTDQWDLIHRYRPARRDAAWVAGGIGVLLALYLASNVLVSALGIDSGDSAVVEGAAGQPELLLYYVPVTLLLVAPTEELVFRGVVQGLFRREYGVPFAIAASSAAFASIHAGSFTGPGAVVSLAVVLLLGAVLGVLYERSESLFVPVLVHGVYNTVQFVGSYAVAVGLL